MAATSSIRSFEPGDEAGIRAVMEASLERDGIPGFEQVDIERTILRLPGDPSGCLVAEVDGTIVGYCIPRFDDLTVHPDHRRRGHGRRLVDAARRLVADRGLAQLKLHAPVDLEATRAFVAAVGARYHSSLWLFRLPANVPVPAPSFPADIVARAFGPSVDLAGYVGLMNAAFADHPTPLSWTIDSVRLVHDDPSFDPSGVLLLAPAAAADDEIAFTKVEHTTDAAGRPAGFIAQIGVLPAWRGRGLGRELLRWGVATLRERGAAYVDLTVEALNERATGLYRRTGFEPTIEWPQYVLDSGPA